MDHLAARLAAAFPDAPAVAPLTILGEGFGSLVVESNGGEVFRIAKHGAAQRGHQREARVLPIIQRAVSSLEVPRIAYVLEASAAFPYGVLGYRKLPGRPLSAEDIDDENRLRIATQVAEFLTALHAIDTGALQSAALPLFPPAPGRLEELWQNVSAHLAQHLERSDFHAVQQWLRGLLEYGQAYPYTPTLVHGDFWYENLLYDEEQRRLIGVIDFENVAIGDRAIDLATQRYLGDRFTQAVSDAYFQRHIPIDLSSRMDDLLGLRELLGLEHGLTVGNVDPDALRKVQDAILPMAR